MIQEIRSVLLRDLRALQASLKAYPNEDLLWVIPIGISNSAGTLALHIAGNLQYYIGALLGGTGYVRDRTSEFSDRDVPLSVIAHRIDAAIKAVGETFDHMDDRVLDQVFPVQVGGHELSTRVFLTHLISHTAYHLGQIDYHRRLITGINRPGGPPIAELLDAT